MERKIYEPECSRFPQEKWENWILIMPWFLVLLFLPLPLAISLSLVLADLAVSDCDLSLLQACVSVLLGDQFSLREIWIWWPWHRVSSKVQLEGSCPQPFLGSCVLMPPSRSLLGQDFKQNWWSYLHSKVCQQSWENNSLPYLGIGSCSTWSVQGSWPSLFLNSCV